MSKKKMRLRLDPSTDDTNNTTTDHDILCGNGTMMNLSHHRHGNNNKLTIESLLSIPIDIIFRQSNKVSSPQDSSIASIPTTTQTPSQHFLLSRLEATTLLRISTLSSELDCLLDMMMDSIYKSHTAKKMSASMIVSRSFPTKQQQQHQYSRQNCHHYYLKALQPLLYIHGSIIPQQVLQYVQTETERISYELISSCHKLHSFAEQNWNISNMLYDTLLLDHEPNNTNKVTLLAKEKRILAEIQEELCRRIDSLIQGSSNTSLSNNLDDSTERKENINNDKELNSDTNRIMRDEKKNMDVFDLIHQSELISMEEFCRKLFHDNNDDDKALLNNTNNETLQKNDNDNNDAQLQQQQENHNKESSTANLKDSVHQDTSLSSHNTNILSKHDSHNDDNGDDDMDSTNLERMVIDNGHATKTLDDSTKNTKEMEDDESESSHSTTTSIEQHHEVENTNPSMSLEDDDPDDDETNNVDNDERNMMIVDTQPLPSSSESSMFVLSR